MLLSQGTDNNAIDKSFLGVVSSCSTESTVPFRKTRRADQTSFLGQHPALLSFEEGSVALLASPFGGGEAHLSRTSGSMTTSSTTRILGCLLARHSLQEVSSTGDVSGDYGHGGATCDSPQHQLHQ
ncbi:hypothetical protein CEXT_593061 [Caerostris extrusa]|uniref:Uncharacterized protein n=1 Tax=Caerostris extrusa TaxID=172846 RepID=A0AAV4QI16_CAEEX|nr:hypothetical protein CEXT_593061 [Caerostris extrusa]